MFPIDPKKSFQREAPKGGAHGFIAIPVQSGPLDSEPPSGPLSCFFFALLPLGDGPKVAAQRDHLVTLCIVSVKMEHFLSLKSFLQPQLYVLLFCLKRCR